MRKEYKLPEVLLKLIKDNKITRRQLAEDIGVNVSAVSCWIKFKYTPEIFNIIALSEYFGVSIDYLVYGEE